MSGLYTTTTPTTNNVVDLTCIPKRYSPCPASLLDARINANRPRLTPNAVVVLVFFITVLVWIAAYFGFMWLIKRDLRKMHEEVEKERVRLEGGSEGSGNSSAGTRGRRN